MHAAPVSWEGLGFVGGFYLFYSLTLGKSSWCLVSGTLLLQLLVLGICEQSRVALSCLSSGTLAVSFKPHFQPRTAVEAEWGCFPGFLGESSFLPPRLPSLRCLISLHQQLALGVTSQM